MLSKCLSYIRREITQIRKNIFFIWCEVGKFQVQEHELYIGMVTKILDYAVQHLLFMLMIPYTGLKENLRFYYTFVIQMSL